MRGFINVTTEAGPVVLGVAQIASIVPGGKRTQWAHIRMSNGQIFEAQASLDRVLDLIDEATFVDVDEKPSPAAIAAFAAQLEKTNPGTRVDAQAMTGHTDAQKMMEVYGDKAAPSAQAATFTTEAKKRGRPPKNKS